MAQPPPRLSLYSSLLCQILIKIGTETSETYKQHLTKMKLRERKCHKPTFLSAFKVKISNKYIGWNLKIITIALITRILKTKSRDKSIDIELLFLKFPEKRDISSSRKSPDKWKGYRMSQ